MLYRHRTILILLSLILGACGGASEPDDFCDSVEDATDEAFPILLDEQWTGPGNPAAIRAGKLTRGEGDTVFAARIFETSAAIDTVMFVWTDSETLGDAPLVADSVTRLFSTAGVEHVAGSTEDEAVKEARSSSEGQAVILYAENNC